MRRIIAILTLVVALLAPAAAAQAEPLIDACNNTDPDVHVTVYNTAEACLDYPV